MNRGLLTFILLFGLCFVPCMLLGQQDSGAVLMETTSFDGLGIDLAPPAFWTPHEGNTLNYVAYKGPGEGGVFPGIKVFTRDTTEDLLASRGALSAAIRVELMNRHMTDVELVDEVSASIAGRDVLEQLFTAKQGSREVTAMADYFIAGGKQYIFLYFHATSVFDIHLPLARAVFSSIFVHGEETSVEAQVFFYLMVILCLAAGGYGAYRYLDKKAVHQAGVANLDVIRREEEIANGPKGIDFDEWDDDGADIHGGKFNIIEIDN